MIKLFATDLDGTLLLKSFPGADSKIIESLKKTIELGYEIALVTGRNLTEIKMEEELWKLPVNIISMNGGLLLDKNRNIIKKNTFSKEALTFFVNEFYNHPFEYLGADNKWVSTSKEVLKKNYFSSMSIESLKKMERLK